MSEEESTSDWAQLVCVTDTDSPPFLISKDKFTIGRARGCDISHENNKLVSGTHCYILRDDSGKVWLYDTSTNGTLFNSKIKLSKGECREIEHGDEFYVVLKKGEEDVNIGYVFQDLARLKAEEEEDSGDLDQTLEYEDGPPPAEATIIDDSINQEEEEEPKPSAKRKQAPTPDRDASPSSKRSKADPPADTTSLTAAASRAAAQPSTTDPETRRQPATDVTNAGPKKAGSEGEKKEGEEKGEGKEKGGGKKSDGGGDGSGKQEEDAFADTLTCIICQELLYDCVSLQPCMHSFCAGCYSEWMAHSAECPSCRGKVDRINKNHIVNNLVEAYLKEHPEKRRPEEDRKELDAKNKITRDMLYPQEKRRDSSDYGNSDEDSSPPSSPPPSATGGTIFGFGTPLFGASNAYRAVCRQCPTNQPSAGVIGTAIKDLFGVSRTTTANTACTSTATSSTTGSNNNNNNNDTNNNTDQPSTSGAGPSGDVDYMERDKKTMPEPPPYTCRANQNHILCQCCLQIFPDRRAEYVPATSRPQQCTICFRAFCHAYWGCRKADCNGCLAKFADMNFGRKSLTGLILGNRYESDIFTNYLDAKKLAVRDVLAACITRLERGEYSCPEDMDFFFNQSLEHERLCRRIRYLPVKKLFRDEFDYNNWMYALAGYVVEKLGGSRWEDLLHKHLLEPLNMTRSAVLGKTLSVWDDRLANPYVLFRDQVTLSDRAVYDITPKDSAGAMASSADDMAKWMRLLLNKGRTQDGRQLLTEGHWKEMTTPHVSYSRRAQLVLPQFPVLYTTDAYGFGWFTANYRGYPMVWHTGSLYAYTTYIGIVAGIDLGVFVSSNGMDGKNASHIIRQTFFHIADLVLGENPWLNISNACQYPQLWRGPSPPKPASNITCDGHDFDKPDRYVGRYEHQLFEKVDITRNGSQGLYVRYNYLEGRLCRTDAQNSAVFEVVGSMAFIYHPGSDPVYLRLNFSRWSATDGRYLEVSLGKATDKKHELVFERGGKPQSSACGGDHGNGWRMGILLLAVAFLSLHIMS